MRLYVGNLSLDVTEHDLSDLFAKAGPVTDVLLVKHLDTGKSRGYGFVEMSDADAERAMQNLNGQTLKGRPLVINEANAKKQQP